MMQRDVVGRPEELAARAADLICRVIEEEPAAVLGLASGTTPIGLYAELARRAREGLVDFSHATAFAIDEFFGVPRSHPATNASYFRKHLAGVPLRALHVLDSETRDAEEECGQLRLLIDVAGGFDLVVLGIGVNGHIAFNEPGSPFHSHARRVELAEPTRAAYAPAFGSLQATPRYGLTLGIADLMASREVLLLSAGDDKAAIVAQALEGPVTEDVPASVVQRHGRLTVVLDRAAASRLTAVDG